MAIQAGNFAHAQEAVITATLATLTSSAAIQLGQHGMYALTANGDIHIRVGDASVPAPTATTGLPVWSKVYYTVYMGENTHIRIFNPTGGNVNYYLQRLSRA
jgi:hypothetical protein